ncbi:MAG TPA: SGNH/GDSL hydrolase family protein [Terriglobales bacterium]|nr:SGNH/GDSL hydrolase family protein [Terriglobales bacterium]
MRAKSAAIVLLLLTLPFSVFAQSKVEQGRWVSAWSTAVHTPLPFPGLPPTPVIENQTVRMVVRPSIGGARLRIRFSNTYGSSPLEIGAAHVALTASGSSIQSPSDHVITFNGRNSVTIPAGAPLLSDPVDLKISPMGEISVSIYLPHSSTAATTHFWAQHDTYISKSADVSGASDIAAPTAKSSWYWLSDVEVWTAEPVRALVTFGDSITDGAGAKQGNYADWPDQFARRLLTEGHAKNVAVLNEGIGGNRILHDGAGTNALARFDRDVLSQPGVTDLIVLEGINDIGWPHMKPRQSKDGATTSPSPFAAQGVTAAELIAGMQQIVDRAHQHQIRVYGATLTPYRGADYFSEDGEQIRQSVNQWIRTGGAFDGVIDFDAAVRDPAQPSKFRDAYQSGDYLHPNEAGYKAMADAIDLTLFRAPGN